MPAAQAIAIASLALFFIDENLLIIDFLIITSPN